MSKQKAKSPRITLGNLEKPDDKLDKNNQRKIKGGALGDGSVRSVGDGSVQSLGDGSVRSIKDGSSNT